MIALFPKQYGRHHSKFHSQWTEYKGVKYASKREAAYAAELDLLIKAKQIKNWRRQVRFPLIVNEIPVSTYVVDFEVILPNGLCELHETKGYKTDVFKLKFALFKALYPDRVIKIIK
jgi:hypothetical protein